MNYEWVVLTKFLICNSYFLEGVWRLYVSWCMTSQ